MNLDSIASWAEKSLSNAGALKEVRKEHLQKFREEGLAADPEAYKYTNISSHLEGLIDIPTQDISVADSDQFYTLHFHNGELNSRPSIKGVTVRLLENASVYDEFSSKNPLTHLHHGLGRIIQIEIDKGIKIDRPLKLNFFSSELSASTVHFKLNPLAELSVMEDHTLSKGTHINATEIYFTISEGARAEHLQIDEAGDQGIHHHVTYAKIAKDARYQNIIINTGGKMIRRNALMELNAPGAHAASFGLYLVSGQEHSDLNTVIHHKSEDTTSEQIAKGILDNQSKGIFTGKIHIHPQAQRVVSSQLNKNLLLSKKAQAHSQPQLEIFADDVKCSHGSTTGQLSDEELFYFEARGIPENKARTLLASGFALEIVMKIEDQKLQAHARDKVMQTLQSKYHLGGQK